MPGRRDNGEIALVTIYAEILGRFVVCVQSSDRNDLHTGADDRIAVEGFLEPELLQRHLTAALNLGFILTAFLLLNLDRRLGAAVLKLNLRTDGPAFPEIVTHIDDYVGQVKLAVMVPGVLLGVLTVTEIVIGKETVLGSHLTVAADSETAGFLGLLSRFRLWLLRCGSHHLLGYGVFLLQTLHTLD